jgi:hypothetical protein
LPARGIARDVASVDGPGGVSRKLPARSCEARSNSTCWRKAWSAPHASVRYPSRASAGTASAPSKTCRTRAHSSGMLIAEPDGEERVYLTVATHNPLDIL